MKSRALFVSNIVAENGDTHFQNSELTVVNNSFADHYKHTDDDPEIDPAVLLNNIFSGGSSLEAESVEKGSFYGDPAFDDNGFSVSGGASYDAARHTTTVEVPGAGYSPDELAGRVAVAGGWWTVVKSNGPDSITVWGQTGGSLTIKQSYRLTAESPCIDAGSAIEGESLLEPLGGVQPAVYELAGLDVDGQLRPDPDSGQADIGADEYGSVLPVSGPSADLNRDGVINFLDLSALLSGTDLP
jgi:hypothetical protein